MTSEGPAVFYLDHNATTPLAPEVAEAVAPCLGAEFGNLGAPRLSLGRVVVRHGGEIGCCGTCMDARGLSDELLVDGARRSTLEEATDWAIWADKVVTF